jgi:hypothetical protein
MNSTELLFEDWRYIPRFEGIYIISNRGVIVRLARLKFKSTRLKNPRKLYYTKVILIRTHKSNSGYMLVNLHKIGLRIATTVHRLLALSFIPNPFELPQVNHKDGFKWQYK